MGKVLRWIPALLLMVAAVALAGCGSGDDDAEANRKGQDSAAVEAAEQKALAAYGTYLDREAAALVKWARQLRDKVAAGDDFGASFEYTAARVRYGHVRPAADLFPALNARINDSDFDRIERGLYEDQSTKGLKPAAAALVADTQKLRDELAKAEIEPLPLAEANERLMEEVSGKMMDGEEQPYSRLDLIDVSASTEGEEAAFKTLAPRLTSADPGLVRKAEYNFEEAYERLGEHGDPARNTPDEEGGIVYVVYNYLTSLEKEEISFPLDNLTQLSREAVEQLRGS
jgi:iron uptake system component EfeO